MFLLLQTDFLLMSSALPEHPNKTPENMSLRVFSVLCLWWCSLFWCRHSLFDNVILIHWCTYSIQNKRLHKENALCRGHEFVVWVQTFLFFIAFLFGFKVHVAYCLFHANNFNDFCLLLRYFEMSSLFFYLQLLTYCTCKTCGFNELDLCFQIKLNINWYMCSSLRLFLGLRCHGNFDGCISILNKISSI